MKVLVLGHNGMLGHMVEKHFSRQGAIVFTMPARWPNYDFKDAILNNLADIEYIINCIGAIPQHKKYQFEDYVNINVTLPVWLANKFKGIVIHPTTDCEFSGYIGVDKKYNKDDFKDARDDYGLSKAMASTILELFPNVIQIRTSILGPERDHKVSLLEWFLSQEKPVNGFSNHYWNGITTLEWAKLAYALIEENGRVGSIHDYRPVVQVGTEPRSKYELLKLINKVYNANKIIVPVEKDLCNKCLKSDFELKSLEEQLVELKEYET